MFSINRFAWRTADAQAIGRIAQKSSLLVVGLCKSFAVFFAVRAGRRPSSAMELSALPADVLLLVAELLNGIELMHLTCSASLPLYLGLPVSPSPPACRRFRDVLSKDEVWARLFCPSDRWAISELNLRHTWRSVYRAWLCDSFWLWKAALYREWPTVVGRAVWISIGVLGPPKSGKSALIARLLNFSGSNGKVREARADLSVW